MLRRRIFSAAMASVMALSSVAVVAQAAETTNQVKTKADLEELVTKTYGTTYRTDELDNYGKTSAGNMLDALEAAEAILEDADSDDADYTAAYMMVVACEARLTQHSLEDLKALLKSAQAELDTNNIFNEELQDQIYNAEKFGNLDTAVTMANSYLTSTSASDIADAYDDLEAAYNDLLNSVNPKVSKSQYRNVLKEYETILSNKFAYDNWRRGTVGWAEFTNGSTGDYMRAASTASFGVFYDYCLGMQDTIQDRYKMIDGIKGLTVTSDPDIVEGYNYASNLVKLFNAWSADSSSKATKAGVKALLNKYHGQLVYDYAKTSVTGLVTAINNVEVAKTPDYTTADTTTYTNIDMEGGSLTTASTAGYYVAKNLDVYYVTSFTSASPVDTWTTKCTFEGVKVDASDIIKVMNKDSVVVADIQLGKGYQVNNVLKTFNYKDLDGDGDYDDSLCVISKTRRVVLDGNKWNVSTTEVDDETWWPKVTKLIGADYIIKPDMTFYVPVDEDGYWDPTSSRVILTDKAKRDTGKYQTIAKNSKFDLSDLIKVTSADVTSEVYSQDTNTPALVDGNNVVDKMAEMADKIYSNATSGTYNVSLAEAMAIAEDYLAGNYAASNIKNIDDTGIIAASENPTNTPKEWALVYRALEYALTDLYAGTANVESYTMSDVQKLIDDTYDLVEKTGDASIFNKSNVNAVAARQDAIAWVAQAKSDKLYKDYQGGTDADGFSYSDSTVAYKALYGCYEQLLKEYNALKYSFGDIYEMLADTADKIDNGELDATDALLIAVDEVAYRLSVVSDITETGAGDYEDNFAFDVDRVFNPNNRVVTNITADWGNGAVEIKTITGEMGTTAKVLCHNGGWVANRNETHYNLITAVNALNDAIAAQAEEEVVLGDANGDGKVNAADATAVLKSIVGLDTVDAAAADYNKDGVVNAADATAILKSIVGLN